MNKEQIFLVKYGIHNFVSCALNGGKQVFYIRKSERDTMIAHAKNLIQGGYGETADIRVI
ncbi:hypothetical protein RYZ26_18145 [Terasakiella sp. A23]|uniref:hypothetical protein n=1 Tax=Terasakiella sp. FCG-A23 TaxID=3080561 RepID=UPI002955BD2F|nr:hypothetical protein [Terasakiella sp. A23]MDV7341532.1 hypothetical protein [Terasakiella sp. A23]